MEFVELLGATSYVRATLATGETIVAERRSVQPRAGEELELRRSMASVRLFDSDGAADPMT